MNPVSAQTLDFFDRHVAQHIVEKYGFDELEAIKAFISSETYMMLRDPELELYKVSPLIIFDMWESDVFALSISIYTISLSTASRW